MKKVLSSILLLLELAACVYSETCPSHEDIYPCSCEEDEDDGSILFSCDDNSVDLEGLEKVLNSLTGKENVEIELDEIKLRNLPSDLLSDIGVRRLHISNCKLDSLTSEDGKPALSGLENTLEHLEIVHSFSESNGPTKLKLGHMTRLSILILHGNTITELGNDWFEGGPTSLEYIIISDNQIKKLEDKVFANLPNLRQLILTGNQFGDIQCSMLPSSAEELFHLDFDDNGFESIPEDIFTNMPSLFHISLNFNNIRRLEENTWKVVWEQVNGVELFENPLECDSHMKWSFNLRQPSSLRGTCGTPRDQEGKNLRDFINSRRE